MAKARQRRLSLGAETKASGDGDVDDFRPKLWQMADALRGSMDAAEYKHVVLGLIFLKYISDAFEERHACGAGRMGRGRRPEDRDEYRRREHLLGAAGGALAASSKRRPGSPASARSWTTP